MDLQYTVTEFIETTCENFGLLRQRLCTCVVSISFFETIKEQINGNEIIVLLDFAESYSFLVQDTVQGYHWENCQATLCPLSVYFKNDVGEVKCLSICIIYDCMKYNSSYIYPQCAHLYTRKASNSF